MKRQLAGLTLIGLVAIPLIIVGLGALSAALWLVLEALRGAAFAWAVIGLVYLGAGLGACGIALMITRRPRQRHDSPPQDPLVATLAAMGEAFVTGMAAGRSLRRGRGSGRGSGRADRGDDA